MIAISDGGRVVAPRRLWGWLLNGLLLAGGAIMLLPFAWMLLSAFKSQAEISAFPPQWFPARWRWESFRAALTTVPLLTYMGNSLIVALTTTVSALLLGSMAGFGFAKHRFWRQHTLFVAILLGMMLPIHIRLLPNLLLVRRLHLLDSLWGVIVPELITIYGVFLFRQYLRGIPDELIDAARVDGASEWSIYWRVILPLCRPALATLFIFRFFWAWDDLLWPLIVLSSDRVRTVPVGLSAFFYEQSFQSQLNFQIIMAASTIALLPVLAVYLLFQRQLVAGLSHTGIKG